MPFTDRSSLSSSSLNDTISAADNTDRLSDAIIKHETSVKLTSINKIEDNTLRFNKDMKRSVVNRPSKEWIHRLTNNYAIKKFNVSKKWLLLLLCFYATFKEVKVGEPFLYKYQTEYLNLTAEEITGEIYPFTPYAYMISLVPIFLLTDLVLYKPIMMMEIIGQIVFRSMLVFGRSVFSQILGQIFYGIASASEIAYFSYIYARLEKEQYQKLTSWTRAGTMAGRTFGYLFSQLLVMFRGNHMETLRLLNIIALISPCCVFIFCIILPSVDWRITIERIFTEKDYHSKKLNSASLYEIPNSYIQYVIYRLGQLSSDFKQIYQIRCIQKWSLWWAMTTCMSLQIALFAQTLWGDADVIDSPLNGFAEATYTATAAMAILLMNAFPLNWDKWGELALVIISLVDGSVLFIYSRTQSIYVMYGCYVCYRSLYQVMITIAQWNIAKKMVCQSYGLVFGVNSFIALVMQSILTMIVTDKHGLGLNVRLQYLVYAALHLVIASIFLFSVILTCINYGLQKRKQKINVQTYDTM